MKNNKKAIFIKARLYAINDILKLYKKTGIPQHRLTLLEDELLNLEKQLGKCKVLTYTNNGVKRKENAKVLREYKTQFEELRKQIVILKKESIEKGFGYYA